MNRHGFAYTMLCFGLIESLHGFLIYYYRWDVQVIKRQNLLTGTMSNANFLCRYFLHKPVKKKYGA
jgi:hypothetical protein